MGGVEIIPKTDKMIEAINADLITATWIFHDLDHYMIKDTHNLAGYAGDSRTRPSLLIAPTKGGLRVRYLHASPSTQHINVDTTPIVAVGARNPYDQTRPLGPLGWGKTTKSVTIYNPAALKIIK